MSDLRSPKSLSNKKTKIRSIKPKALRNTELSNGYRFNGISYTYETDGSIYENNKKIITEQEINQFNTDIDLLAKSNANNYLPQSNSEVYTFIFYPGMQPLYAAKELLDCGKSIESLSVNYCSSSHKGKENDGFFSFNDINSLLGFNGDIIDFHQTPLLVYDRYKDLSKHKDSNVHLVSMFFNQACGGFFDRPGFNKENKPAKNPNKDFTIVDSLLDYVEKDEQLFKGLEQIFAFEIKDKNEEEKKIILKEKLKESSLYQYPIQSENNCGRLAVKFYAKFAGCNDLNEIRAKSRKVLLDVCAEISEEVTELTKQEPSVRIPWIYTLAKKGYAKVNVDGRTFSVRIPKTYEIDFDDNHVGFKSYSNPDNSSEIFHEKAQHGQGVLTGGVLLNLGVSRDQLRYMVNNRDKPIEINVKEPTPTSNRSPDAKIKKLKAKICLHMDIRQVLGIFLKVHH